MFRTRSQLDWTLAVVAIFHAFVADALARTICALPFMPLNIAVMSVAHFFPHSEITSAHAAFQGNNLPFMTLVVVTLPFVSKTAMF
jgi:hypothetical protein